MIAETLAGISLLKASVDFIKSNINTAKDIGEIASAVDGLFRGHDEVQAERSKKSKMGVADQFGIKSVAQEMIDAKLAQEAALAARRQKQKEQAELIETIKMAAIIGITVIGGFGALIWVLWSASAGTPERPPI